MNSDPTRTRNRRRWVQSTCINNFWFQPICNIHIEKTDSKFPTNIVIIACKNQFIKNDQLAYSRVCLDHVCSFGGGVPHRQHVSKYVPLRPRRWHPSSNAKSQWNSSIRTDLVNMNLSFTSFTSQASQFPSPCDWLGCQWLLVNKVQFNSPSSTGVNWTCTWNWQFQESTKLDCIERIQPMVGSYFMLASSSVLGISSERDSGP